MLLILGFVDLGAGHRVRALNYFPRSHLQEHATEIMCIYPCAVPWDQNSENVHLSQQLHLAMFIRALNMIYVEHLDCPVTSVISSQEL